MSKKSDPFRVNVEDLGNKWKCKFCGNKYRGSAPRIRAHLAGIRNRGIKCCEKVDPHVRVEASRTFDGEGSVLNISTGGTSGEGTERIVTSVHQSDDASNPNDTQNSNQPEGAPQQPSCYRSTGTDTLACSQGQVSLPPTNMPLDNLDASWQPDPSNHWLDAAHGNENASSPQQLVDRSPFNLSELLATPEQPTHPEFGGDVLPTPLLGNITTTGTPQYSNEEHLSLDEQFADGITPDPPLYSMDWSNYHRSLPEDPLESRDAIANTSEEIQTNELHNPTVGSSSQIDSSLDVDSANRLQDCVQPCVVEAVPVRSNTSPTDSVQHPGQLPPRCDKEDGNAIHRFPSRTPMEVDRWIASQPSSDSCIFEATNVDSLVPEASANTIGPSSSHASMPPQCQSVPHQSIILEIMHQNPTVQSSSWKNRLSTCLPQALTDMDLYMPSSSQAPNNAPPPPRILPCGTGLIGPSSLSELDMNESAPTTSHPNIGNKFEENRDLKGKLGLLYRKEADIRDELKFAASLSLKKPRMEVTNWLVNMEKLRIDCTNCLPPYQQVDKLMHESELMRQGKGLFEVREAEVNKLIEDKMVGEAFQRNTTKILEYLEENQMSRIGIYGMGGVGKSTIAVHIQNRLLEKANYDNVLWITVSRDFNIKGLQDDLWKALGLRKLHEKDVRKRAAMLCIRLTERGKSTIILDDVWECFDLKEVGIPDGIKFVLTTRSFEVCCQMQCTEKIKIDPLSNIEAEGLFLEELGSEVALNSQTKAIAKSIIEECAGLPLAIITTARSMRGVTTLFEWNDCLEKLRESDMESVLMTLKFSYDRLGTPEIQQCFLSCALYPEDELIDKFKLIEFFIDQGLIGQLNTRKKQYDRGLTILKKLEYACLLEDHGKEMKMHDLIRDMALHVMSKITIVKARKGLKMIPPEEYWTDALEKVSLMENYIEEFPLNMSPNCPKLSIFLFNTTFWRDVVIPNSFFRHLWGLKVLNLSGCQLRKLPDSISDLVNLRALLLIGCEKLSRIPYLGKLKSLRKLDLFRCASIEVLEGLEMLVNLRYLDITGTCIKRLPKEILRALRNLQYLGAPLVNAEDITKLWALETVACSFDDVDDFNKFVRVVSKQRNNPCYYIINVVQKGVMTNDYSRLVEGVRSVNIKTRSHAIVSTGGESSGGGICILIPQDVQKLTARNCDGLTNLSDMGPLEHLGKLYIQDWKNLRVLCGGQDEEVIDIYDSPTRAPTPLLFPSLRNLTISECPKLKYLFGHEPKFCLPLLRTIEICGCEEMVDIIEAGTSPPPYQPPAFPQVEEITVQGSRKMKRMVESEWLPHFPNLRMIVVVDCQNMEEIIGGPPPYVSVEEISPESHLQNLQTNQVNCCEGMEEMISGAGQGQEGGITTLVNTHSSSKSSISLPKLNCLILFLAPELKSICEVPITCYSMKCLSVDGCPNLNRIPLQLQLRDIEDSLCIYVEGEEKWKTLIWDQPDAHAILQSHFHFDGNISSLKGRNSESFGFNF